VKTDAKRPAVLVVAGRIDRSEAALFGGLSERGFAITLMGDPAAPAHEAFRPADVPFAPLAPRSRLDARAVRAMRRTIAAVRPAIIHSLTARALSNVLLAARGASIRHVAYRGTLGNLGRLDPASRLTFLNPRVDRIICVSDAVRRYLLSLGVPETRACTIYKGHDPAWYANQAADPAAAGVPPGRFVAAFAGNIKPLKGVPVLLDACRRLPPDSRVHVLLMGPVRDRRVRRLLRDPAIRARVSAPGFRADARALIGAAQVYVMPSVRREGLPRTVIEAMCQGVPPIVSAVGGMPELVEDGQSGIVVPAGDPAALSAALLRLERDTERRHQLGRAARTRIAKRFHIRDTIDRTAALYRELLRS